MKLSTSERAWVKDFKKDIIEEYNYRKKQYPYLKGYESYETYKLIQLIEKLDGK